MLILAATLSFATASGVLTVWRDLGWYPDDPPGIAEAFKVMYDNTDLYWVGMALDHGDSALVWRRGQNVTVVLKDGTTVTSELVLAAGPPPALKPIRLGTGDISVPCDRLWRKRFNDGRLCTALLVGLSRHLDDGWRKEVKSVSIGGTPHGATSRAGSAGR